METCERCNGNCDSGELVQGICPECVEEIERRRHMREVSDRLLSSPCKQLVMDLAGGGNDAVCG